VGSKTSRAGEKPRKASSNPRHFDSITLQAKPAENTRLVGENAIVLELDERPGVGLRRHEGGERSSAAFALLGPGADGVERSQARVPLSRGSFRLGSAVFARNRRRAIVDHPKFVLAGPARIPSLLADHKPPVV
jgi:hypothetical protein